MNKYELAVVLSAKPEDEERAALLDKVKAQVEKCGGTIVKVEEAGRKKLAYEIQKMNEAFYYYIHFDAEPTVPVELEGQMRIMDGILRYLCVKRDEA